MGSGGLGGGLGGGLVCVISSLPTRSTNDLENGHPISCLNITPVSMLPWGIAQ